MTKTIMPIPEMIRALIVPTLLVSIAVSEPPTPIAIGSGTAIS